MYIKYYVSIVKEYTLEILYYTTHQNKHSTAFLIVFIVIRKLLSSRIDTKVEWEQIYVCEKIISLIKSSQSLI